MDDDDDGDDDKMDLPGMGWEGTRPRTRTSGRLW